MMEVCEDSRFFFGQADLLLAYLDTLHQKGHVAAKGAHGLQALGIFLDLLGRAAVDHVPILAAGHWHPTHGKIFVQHIVGSCVAAAPTGHDRSTHFHGLVDVQGTEEQAVHKGDRAACRGTKVHRCANDKGIGFSQLGGYFVDNIIKDALVGAGAVAAAAGAENGLESALRTELLAHTATGCVYVYDPAARTVEKVLGGVAGAAGLALSPDGSTLYVSDLGSRCIWAVDAAARELTAGGRGCTAAFAGLPGYPGALAADTDGTLYISYRWARSSWLEKNADSTLLRGIALRAGQNTQERLFRCTADAPCAEAVSLATGTWEQTFTGLAQDSCAAVCPVESKVYFGAAGADSLLAANR